MSIAVQVSKYYLGHGRLFGFIDEFDVDLEGNIPTWFTSSLLLICSILLASIAGDRKNKRDRYALHWAILSVIFLLMSLDEAASIHELTIEPLRDALGTRSFLFFPWVIPGTAFVIIFLITYRKFIFDLPGYTRRLFILAGALYLLGVIAMEMISGYYADKHGIRGDMVYMILVNLEELLEMSGIVVFMHALLTYMSSQISEIQLRIQG